MKYTKKYVSLINHLLDKLLQTQEKNIDKASQLIAGTSINGGKIFIFGCTHAGILAQEAFYRTGGLVIMNPILPKGLNCDVFPITMTSALERVEGYGKIVLDGAKIKKGDLLIIHSVSGRNSVPVEMGLYCREKGIKTICITNMEYTQKSSSRHSSGKLLYEVCDIVIDNCGCFGDAALEIENFKGKVSPTSTVIGSVIINAICAEVAGIFADKGLDVPVFMSANIDGGDEYNNKIMKKYENQIIYF